MRRRGWARKVERYCCTAVTYFPLLFVYGLTSWAAWVEAGIGFVPSKNVWTGTLSPFRVNMSQPDALRDILVLAQHMHIRRLKVKQILNMIANVNYRKVLLRARHLLLPHAQLELHNRRLHRSRLAA
jgi:hypothetical protein